MTFLTPDFSCEYLCTAHHCSCRYVLSHLNKGASVLDASLKYGGKANLIKASGNILFYSFIGYFECLENEQTKSLDFSSNCVPQPGICELLFDIQCCSRK